MHIYDLIGKRTLEQALEKGLVRAQVHPTLSLTIYNYTEKAQISKFWDAATMNCRGLIADDGGRILARPFPKFFNHNEQSRESRRWSEDEMILVTDKLDGSLGILYDDGGMPAIATRGSFTSEQAYRGTEILREKYPSFEPLPGFTYLFEIIYPANRIVVDYGGMEDLVLIGLVNIEQGVTLSTGPMTAEYYGWTGPSAQTFSYTRYRDVLAAPPREGREGFVVHFLDSDERVKIKQTDYLRLHKIVTGLNKRVVWEHLQTHEDVDELVAELPDEFRNWVYDVKKSLVESYYEMEHEVVDTYNELVGQLLVAGTRKEFALAIKDYEPWLKASLFKKIDGYPYHDIIWKQIKPKGDE